MPEKFVHLHLHSEYSLLDGISRIKDIARRCAENGMEAVALTDHGVMYGAIEFIQECRDAGIKPIVGCEIYVAPGSRHDRNPDKRKRNSHLVLLAQNETGYRNLSTLVSLAYRQGLYYKPRVDLELLSEYNEGIIATSACLRGVLNTALLNGDLPGARELAGTYRDIFGKDRFYVELQDHGLKEQEQTNPELIQIAKELDLNLVAANDSHFLRAGDRDTQDVMICIQTGRKLTDVNRMHAYTPDHYVKNQEEMVNLFRLLPEAIRNTVKIAGMVDYKPSLDAFHSPEFKTPDSTSPDEYIRRESRQKLAVLLNGNVPENYEKQLGYELDVICSMGFSSYFLIVADFVSWAKNRGIPVGPGRGSAASSLVSWALGITGLDPIEYGLVFERFLNPARKSPPDIDIDFEPAGRAEVIDYVTGLYGEEHVCQIVTFNRLKARGALRDVGRVMDIPLQEVDKMAKLVPWNAGLSEAIEKSPDFASAYRASDISRKWIDTAKNVEGLTRNASVHAAGVIICKDPIWFHAPVQTMEDNSGSVCMYSMNDAEKAGLIKIDFLGLRTLTYIQETCGLVRKNHGIEIDINKIPLDDAATFRLLGSGDVFGIFQMEGVGMRDLLLAIAPDRIEDLMATIALYRPGPMENDLHNSYARRKRGREEISVRHPLQQPILAPTYGILTYQEQISLILQALGGIDLGNATLIMKLISKKKDRESIARYKKEFLLGAKAKGVEQSSAREIWNEMEAFAGYGFNKAHSAAYGLVSYQTAYLKANYPLEFYAAYMTSEMHDTDKIGMIVEEMKRKGVAVYPPDVNESRARFTVEGVGIRYGLAAIKGVGIQAVDSIAEVRDEQGKYTDIFNMCEKIDLRLVNKGVLEALISAGACDSLGGNRRAMLSSISDALDHGKRLQEDLLRGQVGLFADGMIENARPSLPVLEEYQRQELLRMEKESLGFYLTHHPLEDVWEEVRSFVREKISDLKELGDGRTVRIGGMLSYVSRRISRKMQNFALFGLEDLSGKVEGIVFPQSYEQFGYLMEPDTFVVIKGRLRIDEKDAPDGQSEPVREPQIIAEEMWKLNRNAETDEERWISSSTAAPEQFTDEEILLADGESHMAPASLKEERAGAVEIKLDYNAVSRNSMGRINELISRVRGNTPVRFIFLLDEREIVVSAGKTRKIDCTPDLLDKLRNQEGVLDVTARSIH